MIDRIYLLIITEKHCVIASNADLKNLKRHGGTLLQTLFEPRSEVIFSCQIDIPTHCLQSVDSTFSAIESKDITIVEQFELSCNKALSASLLEGV